MADELRTTLLSMQIIAAMLIGGLFAGTTAVVLIDRSQFLQASEPESQALPTASLVAVAAFPVVLVISIVLPKLATTAGLKQVANGTWNKSYGHDALSTDTQTGKLLAIRQTAGILSSAVLEFVGFFGCVGYLIEGQWWALAVPVSAAAMMFVQFPTASRVRDWLETQQLRLQEIRRQS